MSADSYTPLTNEHTPAFALESGPISEVLNHLGELAQALQTTTKTLRFYESKGLLPEAKRSESGYRLYEGRAVMQAKRVIGLRKLGLSIEELQEMLIEKTLLRTRLLGLMDEKLSQQDLELSVLQGRRDDLAARHQALLSTPQDQPGDCICDALLIACTCNGNEGGNTG